MADQAHHALISLTYPRLALTLEPSHQAKLQDACLAYHAGKHEVARRLFDQLAGDRSQLLASLERIEMEKSRGDFISTLRLIDETQAMMAANHSSPGVLVPPDTASSISELLRITRAQAQIYSKGWLREALKTARNVKRTMSSTLDPSELSDIEVQVVRVYHNIIDLAAVYSNWTRSTDTIFFPNKFNSIHGELDALATTAQQKISVKLAAAIKILEAGKAKIKSDTKPMVERLIAIALQLEHADNVSSQFHSAVTLKDAAQICLDIQEPTEAKSLVEKSFKMLATLSNSQEMRYLAHTVPVGDHDDPAARNTASNEKPPEMADMFPRVMLDIERSVFDVNTQADLLHRIDGLHKLSEKAYNLDEYSRQERALTTIGNLATEALRVRKDEIAFAKYQQASDWIMKVADGREGQKVFKAKALGLMTSPFNSLPSTKLYESCANFTRQLDGFDVPLLLEQIYGAQAKAARELGGISQGVVDALAAERERYKQQAATAKPGRTDLGGLTDEAANDPLFFYQAIHGWDQKPNDEEMFKNCILLMRKMAEEEISKQMLTTEAWDAMIFSPLSMESHVRQRERDQDLVSKDVLERAIGKDDSEEWCYGISEPAIWKSWFGGVRDWLLSKGRPPHELARHYTLKILARVRANIAGRACQKRSGDLPAYERVSESIKDIRGYLQILKTIMADAVSLRDPFEVRRRQNLCVSMLSMVDFNRAWKEGLLDDASLEGAQASAEEDATTKLRERHYFFCYHTLAEASRISRLRYLKANTLVQQQGYKKDKAIENRDGMRIIAGACNLSLAYRAFCERRLECLGVLQRMDDCLSLMRDEIALSGSSHALHEAGYSSLAAASNTVKKVLPSHYGDALCLNLDDWLDNWNGVQKAITFEDWSIEKLHSSLAGRQYLESYHRLTDWIQKSKTRSFLTIAGEDADAQTLLVDAAQSPEAMQRIREERDLALAVRTASLANYRNSLAKLEQCQMRMLSDPLLQDFLEKRKASTVSFRDIQDMLRSDAADDVVFVECSFDYYVQSHRRGMTTEIFGVNQLRAPVIQKWIEKHLSHKTPLCDDGADASLAELSPLIKPLKQLTRESETVVLCPTGLISRLPLHALIIEDKVLIARNPVVYCHSFSQLQECLKRVQSNPDPMMKGVAISPLPQNAPSPSLETDSEIASHLKKLREKMPQLELMHREHPDKQQVLDRFRQNQLLYWLGHAKFDKDRPMQSYLSLTKSEEVTDGARKLSGADISRLRTPSPALHLYIACRSGVSGVNSTDDHLGLISSAFLAGASSAMTTLWRIDESDGVRFAGLLFGELKAASKDSSKLVNLAKVMQAAVLEMKRGEVTKKTSQSPYHWAGFAMNGCWVYPSLAMN